MKGVWMKKIVSKLECIFVGHAYAWQVCFALSVMLLAVIGVSPVLAQGIPAVMHIGGEVSYTGGEGALFGTRELRSAHLGPFVKWSGMFSRLRAQAHHPELQGYVFDIRGGVSALREGVSSLKMLAAVVNDAMNTRPYVTDIDNWGRSDYWASLPEFLERGGDCEDFAIAKYTALRMLGVSDEYLRIAIVHDNWKNIAHAVLVVYTPEGPYVLDNQTSEIVLADAVGRYRPIFSINQTAWWLHKAPVAGGTQVAYHQPR